MKKDIYILGVGHNTIVYIDLAEACGYRVAGLYHYNDDMSGETYHGYKVVGSFADLFKAESLEGMLFALSQGDNTYRAELFSRIINAGGGIPTLIHPSANVSRFARIGCGVAIHINAIVHPDTQIMDNTILSYNTTLTHSSSIGNNCFLAGGATIGAYTQVEDFVFIGQGALSVSNKVATIGTHAYIGARSLLTHSVPPNAVVAGSPAKVLRYID